jgi:excinuclease ABC subunit A
VASPNEKRRPTNGKWLTLVGARQNNLKNLTARFPLGLFTAVTGVSGSGKSSLVAQTLQPALAHLLRRAEEKAGAHYRIDGVEQVYKIIAITQEPIGRTPRSNPATYVDVMPAIRNLFALTPEAKTRGYKSGRFSFNVKGGRCEACRGHGKKRVEMHFLPDVWVTCNAWLSSRMFPKSGASYEPWQKLAWVMSNSVRAQPHYPVVKRSGLSWLKSWPASPPVTRSISLMNPPPVFTSPIFRSCWMCSTA